jgi:Tol biopolymer transport system component
MFRKTSEIESPVKGNSELAARTRIRRAGVVMRSMRTTVLTLFFLLLMLQLQTNPAVLVQVKETLVEVNTAPTTDAVSLAISPDGKNIVFVADHEGKYQLWVHSLGLGKARPLGGTDDVALPFPCWSPDSRSVAYSSSGKTSDGSLKRIDIESGSIQTILGPESRLFWGRGCAWNQDGTILFSTSGGHSIFRVSDQGGPYAAATPTELGSPQSPHFLPDGRRFLYYSGGTGVLAGDLAGAPPKFLMTADSAAVYSRSGHLLFVRNETLYAQKFDPVTLTLSGDAFPVATQMPVSLYTPAVSTSAAGHVVYRTGAGGGIRQFKWFDRKGVETGTLGEPIAIGYGPPQISPDGLHVAVTRVYEGNTDIWFLEVATGNLTRFTDDPAPDFTPLWSPDGNTIYFASSRRGRFELFAKQLKGDAGEKLVMPTQATRLPRDVSFDGRFLLFRSNTLDILALQLDGNPPGEFPVVQSRGNDEAAQFSADGRWIAYHTDESGQFEVHVQQFPSGRRIAVSTGGGAHPRWRADGKELFYVALDGNLMAAPVDLAPNGQEARIGTPIPLFRPETISNPPGINYGPQYMVSQDGQRFLIATAKASTSPIKVLLNWQPRP